MINSFRRAPVSLRLALSALAMLIPLGILTYFVDANYRREIDIARCELAGTKALREALQIIQFTANQRITTQATALPSSKTRMLELGSADPAVKVDATLNALKDLRDTARYDGQASRAGLSVYGPLDISRMQDSWEWFKRTGQPAAYRESISSAEAMVTDITHNAKLALDPALNSQMLSRCVTDFLPKANLAMAESQRLALDIISTLPAHTTSQLQQHHRDELIRQAGLYRDGLLKILLDITDQAIRHEVEGKSDSQSLTQNFIAAHERYRKTANYYIEVAHDLAEGRTSASELFNAASRSRSAGSKLISTSLDEMDAIIENRIRDYTDWRLYVISLAGGGLTIALLFLLTTSMTITHGIRTLGRYTKKVSEGDFDAEPGHEHFCPDLSAMAVDVNAMVDTIKGKASYLDSILQGITVPCIAVDKDERITFVNKPALLLHSPDATEDFVMGRTVSEVVYSSPDRQTITGRSMHLRQPIEATMLDYASPDGSVRHLQFDVTPTLDHDGQVTGAFIVIADRTDALNKERRIEQLAAFPREAPGPMLSVGPDGKILYFNTAASNLFEDGNLVHGQEFLPEGHTDIATSCLATGKDRQGIESRAGKRTFSWTYHPLQDQNTVHMYGTDITKRIQAEQQLLHEAFHDTLTGLPNKTLFMDRVNQALRRARRRNISFAILFLDLDGFKNINDGLGHGIGDKLLARFAWRINELLGPDETLARLGGDEFTVLLPMTHDDQHGLQLANRIHSALMHPFSVDNHDLFVTASIGVINGPMGKADADDLIRDAETAMFRAKARGRSRAEVFDMTMRKDATDRIKLENDMKKALEHGEFEPYYQPIVSLTTGRIAGFEALVRWNHPKLGLLLPKRFIDLAEETGLIVPIGSFMLEMACRQIKLWQQQPALGDLTISVNMSVVQMSRPDIGDEIHTLIKQTGLPPNTLKIEVTESGLMTNVGRSSVLLQSLEEMGVSLMIDDFGTGYSSLSHLHQFPFHFLKIDQSFVSSMSDKADNGKIVKSIFSLAHTLGKRVVAEGVETESQKQQLTELGCEFVQGYYFARPMPAAEAEELLFTNPHW